MLQQHNLQDFTRGNNTINLKKFQHLYPFDSAFKNISGYNLHYIDQGSGDPMIMLHGNPTWSFYYRRLIAEFSKDYRVIVPDHIGCGLSDKPSTDQYPYRLERRVADLTELLEQLDLKRNITLVVHDWGGMIGMGYAVRYPERITRVVVMNTAAFFPPQGKKIPWRLKFVRDLTAARWLVLGFNLFSRSALYMASTKRLSADVKAGLTAPYNSWHNRIATLEFVRDIPLTPNDPSYALVAKISAEIRQIADKPILICWGMQDFVFDADYLAEWEKRFPLAETHRFPAAGHYVLEDEPDKIIKSLREFLQNHPV